MTRRPTQPAPPTVLVSGALVRPTTLRLLGWDRRAIEAALGQRVEPAEVVAVEDARRSGVSDGRRAR